MNAQNPSKVGKIILDYLSRTSAEVVPPGFISRYELIDITGFGAGSLKNFINRLLKSKKVEKRLIKIGVNGQIRLVVHYKFSPDIEKIMGLPVGRVGLPRGISRKSPMRTPRTTTYRPTFRECKKRK